MKRFILKLLSFCLISILVWGVLPFHISAQNSVSQLLNGMSTEDKIAQMLIVHFGYGADSNGNQVLTSAARETLRRHSFGGVILMADNANGIADTIRYIDLLQSANASGGSSRPQLLTCVDQEGGMISRLGHGTQTPGNMALGAIDYSSAANTVGSLIGSELSALGINCCFAPDADINSNPANPVIGVRSFSDSASDVSDRAQQFMSGLMQSGTIATIKHFPGHGDTATDSHTGLPLINRSYEQLRSRELVPFKSCIRSGAEMVMTAHIQLPQIDSTTYVSKSTGQSIYLPATLSRTIISGILRDELGFNGVVVTDALLMDAIAVHFDVYDTARLAIEAGVDMLLTPINSTGSSGIQNLETYITRLAAMADSGEISMEKINAAVTRILTLKQRHNLTSAYDGSTLSSRIAYAESSVGSASHHAAEWSITKRAITLVKNSGAVLPIRTNVKKTVILTAADNELLSVQYALNLLRNESILPSNADITVDTYSGKSLSTLQQLTSNADYVIAITELKNAAGLNGNSAQLVSSLNDFVHSKGGKFIILSAQLPYDCARYRNADAIMAAYACRGMTQMPGSTSGAVQQYGPNIPAAIYLMFNPNESPMGRLPVNIPALDANNNYTSTTLYQRGHRLVYSNEPVETEAPSVAPTDEPATPEPTEVASETPEPTLQPTDEPAVSETPDATEPVLSPEPTEEVDTAEPTSEIETAVPTQSTDITADPGEVTLAPTEEILPSEGPIQSDMPVITETPSDPGEPPERLLTIAFVSSIILVASTAVILIVTRGKRH